MGALMIVGAAISAYAAYQQGQSAKKLGLYQQKVSEYAAEDAIRRGEVEAARHGVRVRSIAGKQRTAYGSSGFLISGTKADLLRRTYDVGLEEMQDIRLNAARQAWGLQAQGAASAFQGRAQARAGLLSAAGTMISGIGEGAYMRATTGSWWRFKPA